MNLHYCSRLELKIGWTERKHPSRTFEFLEDELCSAAKAAVDGRAYAIVIRRTGWDGGQVWTLEELAKNPNALGRASPVSRERIRQIESSALATIQKMKFSTPILDRAIFLIEENAPLATITLPSLLQRCRITQRGLGYVAVIAAMKTFQVEWNLVYRTIGQEAFILPSDRADEIECGWTILVEEALGQDFVSLDLVANADRHANRLSSAIAASGVANIPSLGWLDNDRWIYWSLDRVDRGWNKVINVCCKILTVAPEVPLERLAAAVKRARTVRDCPPENAFMNMLLALDEFDVSDEMVSRGASFRLETLSKTDRLMISAAKDAGTVTTFQELSEVLVRRGLSENHAHMLMVVSPFWNTTARGIYRFIANEARLNEFLLKEPSKIDEVQVYQECLVELEITHRHLVTGSHRIDENLVRPGQWSLRDEIGSDLGKINVTASMIKGLNRAVSAAGIGIGTFVIIDFSDDEFTATVFY